MNLQPHGSSGNIILSPSATQISQDWAARQPEHFASFLAGLSPSPHLKRPGSHKKLGTGAGKQPWFWRFSFDPWTEGWNKHWSLKVMTHGLPTIETTGNPWVTGIFFPISWRLFPGANESASSEVQKAEARLEKRTDLGAKRHQSSSLLLTATTGPKGGVPKWKIPKYPQVTRRFNTMI